MNLVVASFLAIATAGYLGLGAINKCIDRESGAIVEKVLSDNTISQLKLPSEVQLLIKSGGITQAEAKFSVSTERLEYILRNNCSLPKCKETLRSYERK